MGMFPPHVAKNLGLGGSSLLYRWKEELLAKSGPVATTLENRVRQLEQELRPVERDCDILKTPWPFSASRCKATIRGHLPT